MRGLKHWADIDRVEDDMSHPTWVRGLKHDAMCASRSTHASHPTWVRGLKRLTCLDRLLTIIVCRTLRGCVD